MKRNTTTIIGNLREGDRFFFTADKEAPIVREVTAVKSKKVKYNKINPRTGKHAWWWDKSRPIETPVMFIRHTQLLPGDECFMHELTDGDVFTRPGTTKEMRRVKELRDGQIAVRYVGAAAWMHTSPLTTGIFVRRASLKTNTDVQQKTTK